MTDVRSVAESEATDSVKKNYDLIKQALNLPATPVFFTYIGPFPEYLDYITGQLVRNLNHPQFQELCTDTKQTVSELIHNNLPLAREIEEWLARYRLSPEFYNFQKDLDHVHLTNVKLAFVCIALREAVKGWAIAAKKLSPQSSNIPRNTNEQKTDTTPDILSQDSALMENIGQNPSGQKEIRPNTSQIIPSQSNTLNRQILPEYIRLCRNEFHFFLKKDSFWVMRVGMERLMLTSLRLFPELIFSPINVVLKLVQQYEDFPEVLYLITEKFPTLAMHRMIFSGYMLRESTPSRSSRE